MSTGPRALPPNGAVKAGRRALPAGGAVSTEPVSVEPPALGTETLHTGSLRRRVVVAVLLLLAVLLLVLSVTVDQVLRQRLEGQLEQRLLDRATVAAVLAGQVSGDDLARRLAGDGVSVRFTDADGQVHTAGAPGELPSGAAEQSTPGTGPAAPGPGKGRGPAARQVVRAGDLLSVRRELPGGAEIVLAADAGDVRRTLAQVRVVLVVGSLAALLLAAVALVAVVGRVLAPLDRMTATARSISAGDRGRRLRPDRPGTELGRAAAAFDAMLDAVEGAEDRALAAEERVRDFLSEAAHELRTPLTGVQAAAELLVRADPPREQREQLAVSVVRQSQRASRLVDDMLTMARIDRGLELHRRPVALRELVRTTLSARAVGSTGPAAVLHDGPPVDVPGDPDRVTQVLANLLDNAARAAGPDGCVQIDVRRADDEVVVDVRDDGPGVPADQRERIFERLVRLDDARSRDSGGAGLGLPIARGIARSHGGDLTCEPAPDGGRGALFRLRLPANAPGVPHGISSGTPPTP